MAAVFAFVNEMLPLLSRIFSPRKMFCTSPRIIRVPLMGTRMSSTSLRPYLIVLCLTNGAGKSPKYSSSNPQVANSLTSGGHDAEVW